MENTETETTLTPEEQQKAQDKFQEFTKNRLTRFIAIVRDFPFYFEELDMAKKFVDVAKAIAMKEPLVLPAGMELTEHEKNKYLREALAWGHFRINSMTFKLEARTLAQEVRGILAAFCNDLQTKIEAVEPPEITEEQTKPKAPYIMEVPMKPNLEAVQ